MTKNSRKVSSLYEDLQNLWLNELEVVLVQSDYPFHSTQKTVPRYVHPSFPRPWGRVSVKSEREVNFFFYLSLFGMVPIDYIIKGVRIRYKRLKELLEMGKGFLRVPLTSLHSTTFRQTSLTLRSTPSSDLLVPVSPLDHSLVQRRPEDETEGTTGESYRVSC